MNRHASVALRRKVDDAVGPAYDAVFLRLDLLLASRHARCSCDACTARTTEDLADLVDALPPVA
jgi:hypothetical protein